MKTFILVYDGCERIIRTDVYLAENQILALQKPLDDRRFRNDGKLRLEDMRRYKIVSTRNEVHERAEGVLEQLTVVTLERLPEPKREGADGAE